MTATSPKFAGASRRHPQGVAAFADAALVARWLSPSPDIALRVLRFEFRVGGEYRYAYDVPGVGTMRVNGVYRAIEPPSRIVFTWNIEPPDVHAGTVGSGDRADTGWHWARRCSSGMPA